MNSLKRWFLRYRKKPRTELEELPRCQACGYIGLLWTCGLGENICSDCFANFNSLNYRKTGYLTYPMILKRSDTIGS